MGHDHSNQHFVHCPWESQHSFESLGTVIFESGAKKAAFNCLHGGCRDKKIFDVTQKIKSEMGLDYLKQFYEIIPDEKAIEDRIRELTEKLKGKKNEA